MTCSPPPSLLAFYYTVIFILIVFISYKEKGYEWILHQFKWLSVLRIFPEGCNSFNLFNLMCFCSITLLCKTDGKGLWGTISFSLLPLVIYIHCERFCGAVWCHKAMQKCFSSSLGSLASEEPWLYLSLGPDSMGCFLFYLNQEKKTQNRVFLALRSMAITY